MLGGPRQRAVLALLASRSRIVPAGQLAEELWRGEPPPTAAVTLRSYVSRLRSALAPDAVLAARGGGYVLEVTPEAVDVIRFERFVAAGGRVRIPTTLNVGSLDLIHPELMLLSPDDQAPARRLMKAHEELGWTAATPFSEGVRRYVDWRLERKRAWSMPIRTCSSARSPACRAKPPR